MNIRHSLASALVGLACCGSAAAQGPAPSAGASAAPPFRFGAWKGDIDDLRDPSDVAVALDGTILVVDTDRNRVARYRLEQGKPVLLGTFGDLGAAPGTFRYPRGIAVAPDGRILVADTGNDRVQVFDAAGGLVGGFGSRGREPGQFNNPTGVAADATGICVADSGNDRVQLFDAEGRFLRSFGGPGGAEGRLNRPEGVAFDGDGRIVVADTGNNRICVFERSGILQRSWGDYGPQAGMMDRPAGVACRAGQIFVADSRNHRVQVFDVEGALLREWGSHARFPREGQGRIHYPSRLAFAPDGAFAVLCEPFEDRCQTFAAAAPDEVEAPRQPIARDEQTHFGTHLAVDGSLLVIPEPEYHRALDLRGDAPIIVSQFGERGDRFGQFLWPSGVAVDAERKRVVVSDLATGRLQVFEVRHDPSEPLRFDPGKARFVSAMRPDSASERFSRAKWPIRPDALARDAAGNILLVDPMNSIVFVFDPELDPVVAYGGHGDGVGQLREPSDIAPNRLGDGYFIVDTGHQRVVHIDRRGFERFSFGAYGTEPGQFVRPSGIAAGRDGFVYVVDPGSDRVQKFDEAGRFVKEWGSRGTNDGEFWKPTDIVQDGEGRLIVLDYGNHRAQMFDADGEWLATFGAGRVRTRMNRPNPSPANAPLQD